ncbi:hypothetical protein [Halobacteriovorax sp. JY17]|uniref:pyroglutamyl-peptidase I family protein n=1 Tax=Halobacteriovorax sp. JY17 TaxID=2014617 RepID=UPI000C456814|nr:hypothetical protein [Halobacteriovorax sp. JY17]PIK13658.1 MAG: pyroglutamyl-peptidase I [Halobacteriovorax sp. JY17]
MKVLVTAFEPFGDINTNCTQMVLNEIKNIPSVSTLLLPVENENAFNLLKTKLEENSYDYVILLGQAANRDCISLERVALNIYDFPIADNKGVVLCDQKIISDEENALFSTLPIRNIFNELSGSNFKCEVSNSAGTYICNELFFKGLSFTKKTKTKLGFIHFPLVKEQNCIKFTTNWTLSDLCLVTIKIMDTLVK